MDVVYTVKHSAANDLEIRYSLRSIAKHFPSVNKVWIFGDKPEFLSDNRAIIEHVAHDYMATAFEIPTPVVNTFQMMFLSSLIPDLTPEYVWFCDDFILLNTLTEDLAKRTRFLEVLDEVTGERPRGLWVDSLWRTYELLKRLQLPRLNFETHTPTYLRRKWVFDAYRDLRDFVTNDRFYGPLGPSAVLNHAIATQGVRPIHLESEGTRAGFWREAPSYETVVEQTRGRLFLNFDDTAFDVGIRRFLREQFPEPSPYEKDDINWSRNHSKENGVGYFQAST